LKKKRHDGHPVVLVGVDLGFEGEHSSCFSSCFGPFGGNRNGPSDIKFIVSDTLSAVQQACGIRILPE